METHTADGSRASLTTAFRLFEQASLSLREEYSRLREEAACLRREVEEKNAMLERRVQEHRRWMLFLTTILERIPGGIVVSDDAGNVMASNGNAERLLGLPAPPAPGTPICELGETGRVVAAAAGHDGAHMACSGRGEGGALLLKVTRTRLPEAVGGYLLLIEDETDAHLLSERSERARRLASMGEMAARIAHEIRNPLTSCRFFLEMALEDAASGQADGVVSNLRKLEGVVGAIDCTVSNMLGFIRDHRPACRPFDPETLVGECIDYVRPLLQERDIAIRVANRVPGEAAYSDPALLRQAFLNILLNAIQAMGGKPGGKISVALSPRIVRKGDCEASYLRFSFRDTGPGIPDRILHQIFDPFFTTRSDGNGLGLTVVQSIMTSLDGFAEVECHGDGGTTFSLLIPHPAFRGDGDSR